MAHTDLALSPPLHFTPEQFDTLVTWCAEGKSDADISRRIDLLRRTDTTWPLLNSPTLADIRRRFAVVIDTRTNILVGQVVDAGQVGRSRYLYTMQKMAERFELQIERLDEVLAEYMNMGAASVEPDVLYAVDQRQRVIDIDAAGQRGAIKTKIIVGGRDITPPPGMDVAKIYAAEMIFFRLTTLYTSINLLLQSWHKLMDTIAKVNALGKPEVPDAVRDKVTRVQEIKGQVEEILRRKAELTAARKEVVDGEQG